MLNCNAVKHSGTCFAEILMLAGQHVVDKQIWTDQYVNLDSFVTTPTTWPQDSSQTFFTSESLY
jgi:hypothetical protein